MGGVRIVKALVAGFLVFALLSTVATLVVSGATLVLLNLAALGVGVYAARGVLRSE